MRLDEVLRRAIPARKRADMPNVQKQLSWTAKAVLKAGFCCLFLMGGAAHGADIMTLDELAAEASITPTILPVEINFFAIVVTFGAVALALSMTLWGIRASRNTRQRVSQWRSRFSVLEAKLDRAETIFSAQPDLVIIWDEDHAIPAEGWGRPKVLGNPASLATLLKYAEASDGATPVETILNGLASQHIEGEDPISAAVAAEEGRAVLDTPSLVEAIQDLRWNGSSFSLVIRCTDGRSIAVEGRPAGAQAVVWVTDVTAQAQGVGLLRGKLSELKVESQRFKKFLDVAPFPVWRRRADLSLAWVNQAYADAVDLGTPQEAVEQGAELDTGVLALTHKVKKSGEAGNEKHYIVIGGQRRALDLIEMPHEEGFMGMALDVTGKDDAENDLQKHIDAHAQTLDKLAAAVAIFDSDKCLEFYNQAYAKLWGLDTAWLDTGPTISEILDQLREKRLLPEQADFKSWKEKQIALHAEITEQPDDYWHLPDARHLRVACQPHPMGGTLFIYEDVTDHFLLESSLNTLAEVQRATLDNLSEGVAVFGSHGRLELHNKSFEDIWQLEPNQLDGQPHFARMVDWCRPLFDEDDEWLRMVDRVTAFSDERHPLAGRLERKDSTIIDYAILPLPNGATLLTYRDVTDTTRITDALRERNEALETADRLKSEFISHVSYQLRTPLTTIMGFAEVLESGDIIEPLKGKQREYVSSINAASSQLMVLMDDILDLARIEAGVMSLELSDVPIEDLLINSRELALRQAEEKQIDVQFQIARKIGHIHGDERRLRQVLFNLISNAVKFTGRGGIITLGAERSQDEIQIWVEDTGAGIALEDQATVFDRFESKGRSGARRGAGLGLSLVRSFVELHGGWVTLQSMPHVGTKVVCHLPAVAQQLSELPAQTKTAAE